MNDIIDFIFYEYLVFIELQLITFMYSMYNIIK